jgi:DNA-binding response OmpR family regulator
VSDRPVVLVVDDDPDIRSALMRILARAGLKPVSVGTGEECLRVLRERSVDVVLLDVAMPGLDGMATLERIRDVSGVLVLMLTAHAERHDKLHGLGLGADDYVTKPFDNAELVARVRALLRRTTAAPTKRDTFDDGVLSIDFLARTVAVEGRPVDLTPTEWSLLAALVRHAGTTLAREQLLDLAWHDPLGIGPERVKFTVLRLRKRLGFEGDSGPIESVRGVGYRYRTTARDDSADTDR